MSNEDKEYTIKSQGGRFTVSTEGGAAHNATIENRNGVDFVQFAQDSPDNGRMPKSDLQSVMNELGGSIELGFDGRIKSLAPQTYQTPTRTADDRMLLSTLVDHQGRPCTDMRAAVANPENFRVSVAGTQTTLANAMRLGWINVEGAGNLNVNHDNLIHDMAPAPPQKAKAEMLSIQNPAVAGMSAIIESAGFDPANFFAKALGNGTSAAKELAGAVKYQDPGELQDLLVGTLQTHMEDVGAILEQSGLVPQGEGAAAADFVFDKCEPSTVGRRLLHGTLLGAKGAFEEIAHRYKTRSRY